MEKKVEASIADGGGNGKSDGNFYSILGLEWRIKWKRLFRARD